MASSPSIDGDVTRTKNKLLYTTSNPFERMFGYHRAVRRGPYIAVSGTTALKTKSSDEEGKNVTINGSKVEHPGDAYGQAILAMERCIDAVKKLNGTQEDIIRVKMFVSNYDDCGDVGKAYQTCFGTKTISSAGDASASMPDDIVGAAATMIVVKEGFVDKDILVEVEVDAFCT